MFVNTRGLGSAPNDLCPLGAERVAVAGVPRVAAVYRWGGGDPTVLALHGWGTESTTMTPVADAAVAAGATVISFDAPGHGASPGSQATITEYARAVREVLQHFSSIHTVVAHSLAAIAAVGAVAESCASNVRSMLLLAPACSLARVLDRWVADRGLPAGVGQLIERELARRDGIAVSHWDIRTLALPAAVDVTIIHDPGDRSVPLADSHLIAAAVPAHIQHVAAGTGHHAIVGSDEMRTALAATLHCEPSRTGRYRDVGE